MKLKEKTKIIFSLIFAFGFLFSFSQVYAQVKDSDISVSVSPEIPGPSQDVSVTLKSFSTDLNKAQIYWTLNGKLMISGTGKTSFSFQTDASASPATIDVDINISNMPAIRKRIIIQPGEVDLLWQAVDSYVPPFYRGKALPSSEAMIKVTAMPNITAADGTKLKASDFSYNWTRGFNYDQDLSGYAKQSYLFKNSYLEGEEDIDASISSVTGNYAAENKIAIIPSSPKIIFYENIPALGTNYAQAITGGFNLKKSSIKISAVPYFFSADPLSSDLNYSWMINNEPVDTPAVKDSLVIKVDAGSGSQSSIGLSIDSLSKLFQSAKNSALIDISQ